jgi:transcriptional regulator with GAF, ATPase, and Fis domain
VIKYELKKLLSTIGKSPENTFSIPSPTLAELHCHIRRAKEGDILTNVDPAGRTFVNGRKIKECLLKDKDEIRLGDIKIIYSLTDETLEPLQAIKQRVALLTSSNLEQQLLLLKEELKLLEKTFQQKEKLVKNLKTLYEIGSKLPQIQSKEELFATIIELGIRALNCNQGVILLKEENGTFTPVAGAQTPSSLSRTMVEKVIKTKAPLLIADTSLDNEFKKQTSIIKHKIKSILCLPLKDKNEAIIGLIYFDFRLTQAKFSPEDLELITGFANYASIALENLNLLEKEKEYLKNQLIKEYNHKITALKEEISHYKFENLIFSSSSMKKVVETVDKVASSDISVLIIGETGTGKELVARALHERSTRKTSPFIVINCGAIPKDLLEAELFGYEKGAFTGAVSKKLGKFELAHRGSVFLDEIGELPLALQVKILRVLQEKEIERLGGREVIPVDVRIIAASNKDLAEEVKKGNFREDLYYRLNVVKITLPPLAERREDIKVLADYFLNKFKKEYNKEIIGFTPSALQSLVQYSWPGNVRELENKVRRAVVVGEKYLTEADLELPVFKKGVSLFKHQRQILLEELERKALKEALATSSGNISEIARRMGLDRKTVRKLLAKYKLNKK